MLTATQMMMSVKITTAKILVPVKMTAKLIALMKVAAVMKVAAITAKTVQRAITATKTA